MDGIERLSEDLATATEGAALSRGLGRSYGDASLPPGPARVTVGTRLASRILDFHRNLGVLHAEAGCSLAKLNAWLWPAGWSVPVSPGCPSDPLPLTYVPADPLFPSPEGLVRVYRCLRLIPKSATPFRRRE